MVASGHWILPVVTDRPTTVDKTDVNLCCLVRALSVGAFLMLCAVGRADSFFRTPAGELAGLSRTEIIAALGNPSSFAASNGQEILVYPFGRIDLTNGKVISADEGVKKEFHKRIGVTPAASTKAPATIQSRQPPTPMAAQGEPLRSAAAQETASPVAPVSRTGLEPFIKMVGILAGCVVAIGSVRILALRRRRERFRAEAQRASNSGQPARRAKPSISPEDTRPWHDYDSHEPLAGYPDIITPLTSHDRLAPQSFVGSGWSLGLLRAIEWKRFEDLTAAYFGEVGFIAKTTGLGADGGVDVELYLPNETMPDAFVQCKAWAPSQPVGVKPIRELFGVMAADGVDRGVFVTTSTFTDEATAFARGKALELVNAEALLDRIHELPADAQLRLLARATEGDYTTPSCPKCGTKMVHRTAGKGRDAGESFWGCANYPRCRQTIRKRRDNALA